MGLNLKDRDLSNIDPTGGTRPKIKVEGDFKVRVESIREQVSKRFQATYYIVEFTMLESDHQDVQVDKIYSWSCDMEKTFGETAIGLANVINFMMAVLGVTDEDHGITGENIEESWEDSQPFKGQVLKLHTNPKTSGGGNDYCIHTWAPLEEAA